MPWYLQPITRSSWHVVDQITDGSRRTRSHAYERDAVLHLQREMLEKIEDGCYLRQLGDNRLAVFREGVPVGWIGYMQCTSRVCPGCDALESAARVRHGMAA